MKKAILYLAMLLFYLGGTAQNPGWTVPNKYVKFETWSTTLPSLPVPTNIYGSTSTNTANDPWDGYDANQTADYASNMMLDQQGNIRFFIVDGFIYDGEGNFIDYLQTPNGNMVTGYSEIAIVPDPSDCDRYYIIAHRILNYDRLPYVLLLDMGEINLYGESYGSCSHFGQLVPINGTGDLSVAIENITPNWAPDFGGLKNSLGFIAVSDLRIDNSYLAFVTNKQGIFRYKIDATGFHYDNELISFPDYGYNQAETRSEMELIKLSSGNYRIAVPYGPEFLIVDGYPIREVLFTAELNSNGALIGGSQKYFYTHDYNPLGINKSARFKGLEFSEDGSRLYVTRRVEAGNPQSISQFSYYDWNNPTPDLVPFTVPAGYDVQFSQIELSANDDLYLVYPTGLLKLPSASSAIPGTMVNFMNFTNNPTYAGFIPANSTTIRLYLLPDQIDGMDYEAYQVATQQCCIDNAGYEAEKYVASSATWSPTVNLFLPQNPFSIGLGNDVYIQKELRIPAGVNLTINNMNFHFAPGARCVVENGNGSLQGGKLTLNNTTFTVDDRCADDLWLGVEVWGNTANSQGSISSSTQGRLLVQNGSEISHAFIGAFAGKRNSTIIPTTSGCPGTEVVSAFSFDGAHNGGIIVGINSTWLNNQRGVYFRPYIASTGTNNKSYFKLCDFIWDAPLKGGHPLRFHAQLSSVKGIRFTGDDFENQAQSMFSYTQTGTGIYAFRSQFYVQSYCPVLLPPCTSCANATPSTFEHLRYGIRTYHYTGDPLTYTVNRSEFEDCQYGISSYKTDNARISQNQFNIRQASYQTAGIVLNRTPNYSVQENELAGNGSPIGQLSYGIVVKNTGIANNDIYKNTFESLHIGAQSEGDNAVEITANNYPGSTNFNMSGLNYTCNNFELDIDLADMTIVNGRIDLFQGHAIGHASLSAATMGAARNYFSLDGESISLEHDITVSGTNPQEIQYVGLATPHYLADSYSPNWVLPLVSSYMGTQATTSFNMCPSKLCEKHHVVLVGHRQDLLDLKSDLNQELQRLDPRDLTGRRKILDQINAATEQLDLLTKQIACDILTEEEDLATIRTRLEDIDQRSTYLTLTQFLALDQSQMPIAPAPLEVDNFLPIVPAGGGRKVAASLVQQEKAFSISPNPSSGDFAINFEENIDAPIDLTVVALMGKILFQGQRNAQQRAQPDLKGLNNGVYFLLVKSEGNLLGSKKIEILK